MSSDKLSTNQQKHQNRVKRSKKINRKKQAMNITFIVVGSAILLAALYFSSQQPITDLIEPIQKSHPMADGNALGDPNAPVTVELFSDFKCPACQYFYESVEPLIIQEYVET
ncbi:MAG: thioredoxin domain-containing protein, partial [Candidatus Heimdallarchaeota archaeon]|nr:thioredoxin domain-containing protein [Candidatus Heimdallarchaeota archaeon]